MRHRGHQTFGKLELVVSRPGFIQFVEINMSFIVSGFPHKFLTSYVAQGQQTDVASGVGKGVIRLVILCMVSSNRKRR